MIMGTPWECRIQNTEYRRRITDDDMDNGTGNDKGGMSGGFPLVVILNSEF
jgi:hypothetical protein